MERLQTTLFWTILVSETTHVFCCVLPTVISIASLLSGMGAVSFIPASILDIHEYMHDKEVPLIIFSAVVLALGWGLYALSIKIDCHDTGCVHEPCKPKKKKASGVLMIATALFALNTIIYLLVHSA